MVDLLPRGGLRLLTISFSVNGNTSEGNQYAASTAQGWAVFAAATMTIALVLWGLVLLRITLEEHDRMYGRAPRSCPGH